MFLKKMKLRQKSHAVEFKNEPVNSLLIFSIAELNDFNVEK